MAYPLGTLVRLTGRFVDQNNNPTDPTNVTLFLQKPGTVTVTTPAVARDAVGTYHCDVDLETDGSWTYRWEGVGAVTAATFDIPLVVQASELRTTP